LKQLFVTLGILAIAGGLEAAPVTYTFSGTTQNAMNINNGSNVGSVPAGTPFTGSFTYDDAQTGTQVAYHGGTHGTYSFTDMSLTVFGSTVSFGPGIIDLFFHLTLVPAVSYPTGDSFYVNFNAPSGASYPVAPGGLINGAAFNWVQLALVDNTGTAFTSAALPATLNFSSFQSQFIEFNYGTAGIALGAGNTSTIQPFSTLVNTAAVPPTITTTSLPAGTWGVPYNLAVTATAPNVDPVTLAVTGLPAGLSFNGTSIIGAPGAVGTSNVSITATDTVTKLTTSSTLPLVVHDAVMTFNPSLPNGVANAAYSASFTPATGGTGLFTYSATGLPAGLTLSGNLVSGTPAAASVSTVTLTAADTAGTTISVPVTLTISAPVPVSCSGSNAVESAYVARNPGYVVVNGGLNLLDHLWTTNLTATNTTFVGGLINWYQNGLILSWTGTVDPTGCILTQLTVAPAVTIATTSLAVGTIGVAYTAPVTVSWGVAPYSITLAGLPAGLTYSGGNISGTPGAVGTFTVTITAVDKTGASTTKALSLTVLDQTIGFAPVLPAGTVGTSYRATLSATGYGPFVFGATGLPAGLTLNGSTISGTPTAAGSSTVSLTATDAALAVATVSLTLTINPASTTPKYTIPDESQGKITAIAPDYSYLMVGRKKLIWSSTTHIQVNTNGVDLHTVTSFVKIGMVVQWKGLRNAATNTVLTSQLEIN